MSSPNSSPSKIELAHSIHPASEAYFKTLAPSSKEIRASRGGVSIICTTCMKSASDLGRPLRHCGKCHIVSYCSKECQTQDWPKHKPTCGEAGIPKLIRTLIGNGVLQVILQACFILDFKLLHHSRLNEPLFARVDVAVEPSNILDFGEILLGNGPFEKKIEGMLQVNGFTPATAVQMKSLTAKRQQIWRQERDEANSQGFRADPVVLMEIAYESGAHNSLTFPLCIHSEAREVVREAIPQGFAITSAITGETKKVPYTVETCLEFMNSHIRADKKNQLLLRTEMRPVDIQAIRDVTTNSQSVPAVILYEKMARENIYKQMYQMLLEHRRTVAAGVQ
ncbi:hypothetical protein B0H11DRAFT_2111080 [Mycena galericulata]|nr:hypothetical protein B0H11DRAFT_2111080 [Mycena galericulata]